MRAIWSGISFVLRGIVLSALSILKLALEGAKIMLLLFGLVLRIFLVFAKAGTP
ncbi:hypothetical protein [Anaerobium acetethylicum]|uniref:Uncharacterized protein n=1 Tax=Anaerobium acetethylicum TaxID=1619234 RepID=A0A1D3TXA5_9FIRM|nr:hypothetical protein [Anaerobium acetethylicum]SCP98960.1 hypothetical protein SAMN05421730_102940 [Anaerobium acetethylicum]